MKPDIHDSKDKGGESRDMGKEEATTNKEHQVGTLLRITIREIGISSRNRRRSMV